MLIKLGVGANLSWQNTFIEAGLLNLTLLRDEPGMVVSSNRPFSSTLLLFPASLHVRERWLAGYGARSPSCLSCHARACDLRRLASGQVLTSHQRQMMLHLRPGGSFAIGCRSRGTRFRHAERRFRSSAPTLSSRSAR